MRQTEMDGFHPDGAGRSSERPVSISDQRRFRGRAGDGAECLAALDRRTVLLARPVGGLACRLRLSPRQFLGVALVSRDGGASVRLVHRDPALTVDLLTVPDEAEASEAQDHIAGLLALPCLPDRAEPPSLIIVTREPSRRRTNVAGKRRPRFLHKRRTGGEPSASPIAGHEMIAPE